LGIGLNVTVFAVINGALLRAPVPEPETFVRLSPERGGWTVANNVEYEAYRGAKSLSSLAAWKTKGVLLGNDRSFIPQILLASCNFFQVYGAGRPLAGRLFAPDDCARGSNPAIVLSEEAWRRRLGADPRLVGKSVAIDGRPFTVIGIAPANTPARIKGVEGWVPLSNAALIDRFDTLYGLTLDGRLAPGNSRAGAEAELKVIAARQDHGEPGRKTNLTVNDGSWFSGTAGSSGSRKSGRWALAAVLGGLAMALLIASVNVTSLLLSKASARRSEMALRLSLGAPRGRLIRLQFLESFLLTAAAGAIGVYIAQAASTPLYVFLAEESPRFSLAPDGLTMVYIFGLVFLAACVSGLAPALESLRIDLASALKGAGYGGLALARGARLRGLLISAQTGMSLALLVAAGLFARVFFQIAYADPGFDTNRVIAVSVRFPMTGDSRTDRAESAEVIRALVPKPFPSAGRSGFTLPLWLLSSWLSWRRRFLGLRCSVQVFCPGGLGGQPSFGTWAGWSCCPSPGQRRCTIPGCTMLRRS
jgi:predicted permease